MAKIIDTVDMVHTFSYEAQSKEGVYVRNPFQLVMNSNVIFNDYWMRYEAPFRMNSYALNIVLKGTWRASFNLQDIEVSEGGVFIMSPGLLVKYHSSTKDMNTRVISIAGDFMTERFPAFNDEKDFIIFRPSQEVMQKLLSFFDLLETLVDDDEMVLLSAAYSLMRYSIVQGAAANDLDAESCELNPHVAVFEEFLHLLDEHGTKEHKIAFYADKLAFTPKYLNSIIKEVSGRTMMDWINTFLTHEARAALAHSQMTVEQISDALYFPNSAFFCKFFKHHTGMRPSEYRKSVKNQLAL